MKLEILPAIDIKDGNCVRLLKGDFATAEKVAEDPVLTAQGFEKSGATLLHMVDLDGAKDAVPRNREVFLRVARSTSLKIEVGGGIRNMDTVDYYLSNGIERVILGSAAIKNPQFVKEAVQKYGDRIVVGIDAKNGKVATHGWEKVSDIDSVDLCKELEQIGVKTIVYTDISKDGMLEGPNFDIYKELSQKTSLDIIASGGVTSIDDVKRLLDMNMYGAIIGKALYDNRIDLKEVLDLC